MIETKLNSNLLKTLPYTPNLATVEKIITETWDTKCFRAMRHIQDRVFTQGQQP